MVFWYVVLAVLAVVLFLGWRHDRKHGTRGIMARRDRPRTAAQEQFENEAPLRLRQSNSFHPGGS
jgi:uncharacterized membrane protein